MKQQTKLLAALLLLVTAVVMVITTSFAWMTLATNPVAQGIQITIAGSHTVLVAPDLVVTRDGREYHYPGSFKEHLNFSELDQYAYLQNLGGLIPVSTADGENWYIPTYYQPDDPRVLSGKAYAGQLRPTAEFIHDKQLRYANLTPEDLKTERQGSYVYLDFWVVAPVDGYKLRVSTGDESAGSFAIDLPEPEYTDVDGQKTYHLTKRNQQAAASMRVGFLINEDTLMDESMLLYSQSEQFNSSYHRLQGIYMEQGMSALESTMTRFTIYEPNGDLHPTVVTDAIGNTVTNGQYALTEPIGEGGITESVMDRLTVQLTNTWTAVGEETRIAQMFRTFMAPLDVTDADARSLKEQFYGQWLQYQIYPYVTKGDFLTSTENLYTMAGGDRIAQPEEIVNLMHGGATEDVYLTQLTGGVPQRIRMYIWLEGQDVDCINSAATGSFALSLELAGSNAS